MGYTTRMHRRFRQQQNVQVSKPAQTMIDTYELNAANIKGTGAGGKITIKDVRAFMAAEEEE